MATTFWLRGTTVNGISTYRDADTVGAGAVSFPGTALDVTPGSGGSGEVLWGVWVTGYPTSGFTLAGDISFNVSAGESSTSTNIGIKCRVYKRDIGGTETEIANLERAGELTTTSAERTWSGTPTSTAFGTTDRIVFKIYTYPQGGATYGSGFGRIRYDAVSGSFQGESTADLTETVTFSFDDPATELTPTGVENISEFGGPTTTTSYTLTPTGAENTFEFGGPIITTEYALSASGFENTSEFGDHLLGTGDAIVVPGVLNTSEFGTVVITTTVGISASGFENTSDFGSGAVTLYLVSTSVVEVSAFGTAVVKGLNALTVTSTSNTSDFGTAVVVRILRLLPEGIINSSAFGTHVFEQDLILRVSGTINVAEFGAARLARAQNFTPVRRNLNSIIRMRM